MVGMALAGGGGSAVGIGTAKFTITPYSSTDNLPAAASENDIAVITSDEITCWAMRAEEPATPAEGGIWIVTRESANSWFNIGTEDSPIIVYPAGAYQYLDGAWVYKDSYIWQNNEWKQIIFYLYNRGEEYSTITGDWKIVNGSNGTGVKNAEDIYIGYKSSSGRTSCLYTTNLIDFTPFNKMYLRFNLTSTTTATDTGVHFGVITTNTANNGEPDIVDLMTAAATNGETVKAVDISAVTGEYYVGLWATIANAYIYQIWLE